MDPNLFLLSSTLHFGLTTFTGTGTGDTTTVTFGLTWYTGVEIGVTGVAVGTGFFELVCYTGTANEAGLEFYWVLFMV